MIKSTPFLLALGRSQISAIIATSVDFSVLFCLVERAHVWYVTATVVGAACGAITNFLINRYWSFAGHEGRFAPQVGKYVMVSGMSLMLNGGGVYFLTDHGALPYGYSKLVTSLAVALLFNFPLHRSFVFR